MAELRENVTEKIIKILSLTEGRDKVCKLIQYFLKIAVWRLPHCEARLLAPAKALGDARRVIRLGRFLNVYKNIEFELKIQNPVLRLATICQDSIGALGELVDDALWLSDKNLAPTYFGKRYDWVSDYLWLAGLMFDLPINTFELWKAYKKFEAVKDPPTGKNPEDINNAIAKIRSLWLNQCKLLCDLMHCCRLALDWPTKSKAQDSVFGFLSALLAFYRLWKPQWLQGHRGKSLSVLLTHYPSTKKLRSKFKRAETAGPGM